jgi:hypothetical protein
MMHRYVQLEGRPRRPSDLRPRRAPVVPRAGLGVVDRLALVACVAGGGSGAALILTKLFCL